MKKPKKKIPFPRRQWLINPVPRVKESAKVYSRRRTKEAERAAPDEK